MNDYDFYYTLFRKRLPVMILIAMLCAVLGVALAITLPPRYEAGAVMLLEDPQISENSRDRNGENAEGFEQLEILEQRLMTRANLVDIANKFAVFEGETGMSPDDVVEAMREQTTIDLTSGRDRATSMELSFISDSPTRSANVVNEYVTLLLIADGEIRKGRAGNQAEFYAQQVSRLDDELATRSAEIAGFKEENSDALPEGLEYRLNRQETLQDRQDENARELSSLRDQKDRLIALGSPTDGSQLTPQQQELEDLRAQLRERGAVLSDSNPQIQILKRRIDALESQMTNTDVQTGGAVSYDEMPVILRSQLLEIDSRIEYIAGEMERMNNELSVLQNAIERTPQVSIRLETLEREYENTQALYNQAVANRANAQTEEQIVINQQSQRLRPVEQAKAPDSPTSPNRKLIAGGGIFLGGMLAALFFALTELLNATIRRPQDLTKALGVQPLVTIPYLEEETARQRRRFTAIAMVIVVLAAIGVLLWMVHVNYKPLDLIYIEMLARIGL